MISHPRLAVLATGLLAAGVGAALAFASPAAATGGGNCTTKTYWNTDGVTVAGGATAAVTADGIVLTTPDIPSEATWKVTLAEPVKLSDVTDLSYITRKTDTDTGDNNDAAIAAFHLYLDVEGTKTTLVYEPYYQISGNPARNTTQTWDVDSGKFWATVTIPGIVHEGGGSYAGNRTLAQVKAANPQAKVIGYGFGQGTYNKGTISRVNYLKFAGKHSCVVHVWDGTKKPSPSPSTSKPVSPSPTVSKSATSTATATRPVSPKPTSTSLPVTGPGDTGSIVGVGAGLLAVGGALIGGTMYARRRREQVQFKA